MQGKTRRGQDAAKYSMNRDKAERKVNGEKAGVLSQEITHGFTRAHDKRWNAYLVQHGLSRHGTWRIDKAFVL